MNKKNIIKNRSILLAHDIITKYPKEYNNKQNKNKLNFLNNIDITSNIDFKPYKGYSYNSIENKGNSVKVSVRLKMLMTFYILKKITGQLPHWIKGKKSVANFNIRAGMEMGVKLTLRKKAFLRFYKSFNFLMLPVKGPNKFINPNDDKDMSFKELGSMQPKEGWKQGKNKKIYTKNIELGPTKLTQEIVEEINNRYNKNIWNEEIKELLNISNHLKIEPSNIGGHLRWNLDKARSIKEKSYILTYFIIPS